MPKKIFLLDNYDSFTYNLWDYIERTGAKCIVKRNSIALQDLHLEDVDGIVLSPGPKTPQQAGILMPLIAHYYTQKPILGVCLGHQGLGAFFGAAIVKAQTPMHGQLSLLSCQPDLLFEGLPKRFEVVRYNSLLVDRVPEELEGIGYSETGEIMALRHKTLPLRSVQFHPEAALTSFGLQMIQNWINSL